MEKEKLCGVIAPLVNPCTEDDEMDIPRLLAQFERLLESGVHGMYLNGGTGDAANLTQSERLNVADRFVPRLKAAGRSAIVHVGQTTQREAVSLAEGALKVGADAVSSIPPRKPWPQVAEYYKVLTATGAPVIVYYIPGLTGQTASMDDLCALLDIPGVVGIKMSDFNIFLLKSLTLQYPEKVIYSGFDEMLLPGLLYGADGCIGTWINLFPSLYLAVWNAVRTGRVQDALPLSDAFTSFLSLAWRFGVLDTFEELMRSRGYADRCFRRPSSWNPGKVDVDTLCLLKEQADALNALANQVLAKMIG